MLFRLQGNVSCNTTTDHWVTQEARLSVVELFLWKHSRTSTFQNHYISKKCSLSTCKALL